MVSGLTSWAPRFVAAVLVNAAFAGVAWRAAAVDRSGAVVGALLGIVIASALGTPGFAVLAVFVVLGSGFTRLGYQRKLALGAAEERHGARTGRQAVANVGVAAVAAVLAAAGLPWARVAFVGALAAATADTTESELGTLWGRRAVLLPRLTPVPCGTEGAVSATGTACGALAALAVAGLGAGLGLLPVGLVPAVGLAALAATLLESLVGGGRELSNNGLNLLTTTAGAVGAALVSLAR